MKTTIEIQDALLERAKRQARKTNRSLRALVEEGLRRILAESRPGKRYRLPDRSVGDAKSADPLDARSWQDLRSEIYGER